MPSTFARTVAVIAPSPVIRCSSGLPHHWRVDSMEDCREDAALDRVREHCLRCDTERYSPRYFSDTWSKAVPARSKKKR